MIAFQIGLIILSIIMVWHEICAAKKFMKNNTDGKRRRRRRRRRIIVNEAFTTMIDDFKKDPDFDLNLLDRFINFRANEDTKAAKRMCWSHWLLAVMWICNGLSVFCVQILIGLCILACIEIGLLIYDIRCFDKMEEISDKMFDEMLEKRNEKRNQTIKSRFEKPCKSE